MRILGSFSSKFLGVQWKVINISSLLYFRGKFIGGLRSNSSDEYKDIRVFKQPECSVTIVYVYIAAVLNGELKEWINSISEMCPKPVFDVVIASSYLSDMS